MPFVMTLIPLQDTADIDFTNGKRYLKSFDPDAFFGRGHIVETRDIRQAKRFVDLGSLFTEWKRQSNIKPLRPDGKPNRPLTAYSMTPEVVKE
jgi:hypothetical protein